MAKIRSPIGVVCDAGPIIHLDEIGCLQLINDFKPILIPETVYTEVSKYRPEATKEYKSYWTIIPRRSSVEESLNTMCRMFSLDIGETEALVILHEESSHVFLTDDAAARLVAEKFNFKVHGTIGVLIRAIRRDLMSPKEVIETLNHIPEKSTLYIKKSLLEEAISLVKQEFGL